jgi:Na+-driven multidrug efflux pump
MIDFYFPNEYANRRAALATMLSNRSDFVFHYSYFRNRNSYGIGIKSSFITMKDHKPSEVLFVGLPSTFIILMAPFSKYNSEPLGGFL